MFFEDVNTEIVLLINESHFSAISLYCYRIKYFVSSSCCSSLLGSFVDALTLSLPKGLPLTSKIVWR